VTLVLALAAHQGEEFVIILPAIMLLGAFFILRWANQPTTSEEENASKTDADSPDQLVDEPEQNESEEREPAEVH
jgi:hypothetical protein